MPPSALPASAWRSPGETQSQTDSLCGHAARSRGVVPGRSYRLSRRVQVMKHKVKRIHFVGIGGSGMSGIAEVLANLGFQVSGSDLAANAATRRLEKLGVKVVIGHARENLADADAVVTSTAVKS